MLLGYNCPGQPTTPEKAAPTGAQCLYSCEAFDARFGVMIGWIISVLE